MQAIRFVKKKMYFKVDLRIKTLDSIRERQERLINKLDMIDFLYVNKGHSIQHKSVLLAQIESTAWYALNTLRVVAKKVEFTQNGKIFYRDYGGDHIYELYENMLTSEFLNVEKYEKINIVDHLEETKVDIGTLGVELERKHIPKGEIDKERMNKIEEYVLVVIKDVYVLRGAIKSKLRREEENKKKPIEPIYNNDWVGELIKMEEAHSFESGGYWDRKF